MLSFKGYIIWIGSEWATSLRPILSSIALFLIRAFTLNIYFLKAEINYLPGV